MCIIMRSEKGFNNIDDELINDMYQRNPHGFGYMYHDPDVGLVIHKDLYKVKDIKRIMRYELPDDRPVYVHFRKATSGSVTANMAHPYMVNKNLAMLHNGVMRNFEPQGTGTKNHNYTIDDKGKTQPSSKKKKKSSGKGNEGPSAEAVSNVKQNPNDAKKASQSVKSKSKNKKTEDNDTLNFMETYLRPALKTDPRIYLDDTFIDKTESVIGINNKLVFMDSEGNETIYNQDQWIEYEGVWFSNTYAWPYYYRMGYGRIRNNNTGYHSRDFASYDTFARPDGFPYDDDPSYRDLVLEENELDREIDAMQSGWYRDMPKTISSLEDLEDLDYQQLYSAIQHEPDEIASILYYEVLGYRLLTNS